MQFARVKRRHTTTPPPQHTVTNTTTATNTAAAFDSAALDADYATAWRAADLATVDLVAFADVAAVVDSCAARMHAARRECRNATPDVAAAYRVRDAVADAVALDIADAVADVCDGYEPDAVAVVVVAADRLDAFFTLQRAGVAVIACENGALWLAADGVRPALAFANVAAALAYASGHAAPKRRERRGR